MYYVRIVWVMKWRVVWNWCRRCFGEVVDYFMEVFVLIFDEDDIFVVGYLVVDVFVVFNEDYV